MNSDPSNANTIRMALDGECHTIYAACQNIDEALILLNEAKELWETIVGNEQSDSELLLSLADLRRAVEDCGKIPGQLVQAAGHLASYICETYPTSGQLPDMPARDASGDARMADVESTVTTAPAEAHGPAIERMWVPAASLLPSSRAMDFKVELSRISQWEAGESVESISEPIAHIALSEMEAHYLKERLRENHYNGRVDEAGKYHQYAANKPRDAYASYLIKASAQQFRELVEDDLRRTGKEYQLGTMNISAGPYCSNDNDNNTPHVDAIGDMDADIIRYVVTLVGPPTQFVGGEYSKSHFGDAGEALEGRQITGWKDHGLGAISRFRSAGTVHRAPVSEHSISRLFMTVDACFET